MITRKLFIALAGTVACLTLAAQQESTKQWEYKGFAGYNLGGSTPLPLPAEIRKIHSWSPGFSGTLAFHVTRWLTREWGVTSGLAIDVKGMSVQADVKYMNTSLVVGEGDHTGTFTGMFTGRNTTTVRNGYLVVPLMAAYRPPGKWAFRLGGYVAFQRDARFEGSASDGYIRNGGPAGDRINIEMATFDFSDHIRKTDAGAMASADWFFTRKLALTGQLSWGFVPLLPTHFTGIPYKLYNLYFMGGIGYRL
jgi:hypothetical protein